MLFRITLIISIVLVVAFQSHTFGQGGVSSMSVGASRAGIGIHGPAGRFLMPSPDMIRVEEYINYHRHALPLPAKGKRVHLDLEQILVEKGKRIVQVGITTPKDLSASKMVPLNLVLVIDRSGSMSGGRIANVKKSIRAMIENFRDEDRITIVGFSNDARIHLHPCRKTDIGDIDRALSEIEAGGGTNLYAGLMLGYSQALKYYDAERTNRVIFLTDGNANIGTTETEEIAKQSKQCNKRGISLSTIGLGSNFNHELLRELADRGHGVAHFINDDKDIKKTFVKEVVSLLAPAANKVRLTIDFGSHNSQIKIFGYQPKKNERGEFLFRLDDLNHGATQVVVAELPVGSTPQNIKATISYTDAITGEENNISCECKDQSEDSSRTESLRRNYAISIAAQSMRIAAELSKKERYKQAEKALKKGIKQSRKMLVNPKDKAATRIIELAEKYRQNISECFTSIDK